MIDALLLKEMKKLLPAAIREAAREQAAKALDDVRRGPLLAIDVAGVRFFGEATTWKQAKREFTKLGVPFYRLSSRDHRVDVREVEAAIEARRVSDISGGRVRKHSHKQ